MIASLLATALLVTSAAADEIIIPFRVDGRTLQSSHPTASGTASATPGYHHTSTSRSTKKKSHSTQSSSISCKASASSSGFSYATDAHVKAVTSAIKYGCSHKIDKKWRKDVEKKFADGSAYAVAEVWAKAKATCTGNGNVYGCAAAYATANRWATATASAYADAYADAYNYCKCNKKPQEAGAYTFGSAEEMKDLVAKVSATADADVCIEGTGSATAYVESHCLQEIYANVWAKSISKALIKGDCYTSLDAKAFATAEAVIDTWEYVDCASDAHKYY